ncbi:unnamed protein product [Sphagnum jensenii]|uniref:Uncharacterized protein n=1 Tax=Sphagnum jensenii TaxID=128206 RepID=A0ABP1B6Q0_9BRYO
MTSRFPPREKPQIVPEYGWSELAATNAPVEDEPVQPVLRMNILPARERKLELLLWSCGAVDVEGIVALHCSAAQRCNFSLFFFLFFFVFFFFFFSFFFVFFFFSFFFFCKEGDGSAFYFLC